MPLVLAAEGWHPGVIGIVASRIAERHHRPAVLIALEGEEGSGSGRSIKRFDLLGGLHASAGHLLRYGGHRAAAGLTIARDQVDGFREAFLEHAASVLSEDDLVPEVRIDAVAQGDALSLDLAEELQQLAPFGMGNPAVSLLVPAATMADPRALGSEGRHITFTLSAGGARSRCVAFGAGDKLPVEAGAPADAAVRLEIDRWNGSVSPRLVLRQANRCLPRALDVLGEPPTFADGVRRELERDLAAWGETEPRAPRGRGRGAARAAARAARPRTAQPRRCAAARASSATCVAPASPASSETSSRPASRCWPWPRTRHIARTRSPPVSAGSRSRRGRRSRTIPPSRHRSRTSSRSTPRRARRCAIRKARAGPTWRGGRLN